MAKSSIKVACYTLTNRKIIEAIVDAHIKGLDVEVIMESDNSSDFGFSRLEQVGVSLYKDSSFSSLMHNKFIVIDNKLVWSGSGNYNYYSFYRNYDNFIRINKEKIAQEYSEEFEELKSQSKTAGIYVDRYIEIYFSPEDNFKNRLLELINSASKSIEFMVYSFSDKDIADALIDAKNRSVKVQGLFDDDWSEYSYSKDEYLYSKGISIRYDNSKRLLHNKVMIIDDKIVVTGSYNFTQTANNLNRENSIVIKNKKIANRYKEEFYRLYKEGSY